MVTIATVLCSGGGFTEDHVWELMWQLHHNAEVDFRFVCLADCETPMVHNLPMVSGFLGWWSKVELFRHGLFAADEQVFYFDLDTVITGDITKLLRSKQRFAMLRPFDAKGWRASGIMSWCGDYHRIYTTFMRAFGAKAQAEECRRGQINGYRGDQNYIAEAAEALYKVRPGLVNDYVEVASYKRHCQQEGAPPATADVVCFHGEPRPWDVEDEWVVKARNR